MSGITPGAGEGSAVPASYKTSTVLLIYTVKSGKKKQKQKKTKQKNKKTTVIWDMDIS